MKTPVYEVEELLSTNLKGTVFGCKFVGRAMLRNRTGPFPGEEEGVKERGVIVNVASLLAQKGVIGTSVYAAAKAGVVGKFLVLSLRSWIVTGLGMMRGQRQRRVEESWGRD